MAVTTELPSDVEVRTVSGLYYGLKTESSPIPYDILYEATPPNFFKRFLRETESLLIQNTTELFISGTKSGPFLTLAGTTFSFRADRGDVHTVYFVATDSVQVHTAAVVATILNDIESDCAVATANRVNLVSPLGVEIEIIEGSKVLGLYESNPLKVLLKAIAPSYSQLRSQLLNLSDIYDPDLAPRDFLRQLSHLLTGFWDESKDVDFHRKLVKQSPFDLDVKGTLRALQRVVGIYGGKADVFEPYRWVIQPEDGLLEGPSMPGRGNTRFASTGVISGGDILTDVAAAPFLDSDLEHFIYMPNKPGPVGGFKVRKVLSASQIQLADASLEDDTNVFYVVRDPQRVVHRLESRDYWRDGTYEVICTIAPQIFMQAFDKFVRPKTRRAWFNYLIQMIADDGEFVNFGLQSVSLELIHVYQLTPDQYMGCAFRLEEPPPLEEDPDCGLEGGVVIDGFEIFVEMYRPALARRTFIHNTILTFDDLAEPAYTLNSYVLGDEDANGITFHPDGYTYPIPILDAIPSAHTLVVGFSTDITRGAGSSDNLPVDVPEGATVLIVNEGGTPDKPSDTFTGGTEYVEDTDWVQTGNTVEWLGGGSAPVLSATYRVFFSYDPFNLFS